MPGRDPLEAAYERRIRLASEVATWGIAAILVASAALPTTSSLSRLGLLFTAALLGVFSILWFHILPDRIFGPLRFTIGTSLTQVVAALLLMLTGGSASSYFVFFLFPTLATTFAMRVVSTLVVGAIGLFALVALVVGDRLFADSPELFQLGAVRISAFIAVIAMTALIARTMQETRAALRQRSNELATQNVELEVSHSTALAIARSRDLGGLLGAVFDAASTAIGTGRVLFFEGAEASERGWAVGLEGSFESFEPDRRPRDSPRQRAVRTRRTVVVNDMADEPMVGERVQTAFGVASGLFVPLIHRGGLVGLVAFTDATARTWTAREVRLAEIIAESVAPSVASFLAIEEVREEREVLAGRMKVLEGMNQLVDALALAQDEATTGQVAARAVAQGFRLIAATTLFVDPSVALLEPVGTAGAARVHPVVNGPTNCPAIRSGRVFQVSAATDAVICPYMPYAESGGGYVCVPLLAGGEPMGALFMEPTVGSVVEDTFMRAAADRVALSLANRRVLETAQRQATTDGLTGLHNRHLLREQLRLLQSLATRHGQPYSVIAFDVDGLKRVNDTFGHEMGDLALRGFANIVRKTIRTSDIGVRTGGDEFLILVPLGGLEQARILTERLRDALAAQGRAEPNTAVTVSAGVAAWRAGRSAEQVLEAADAMLYEAKRAGRDRVAVESAVAAADPGTPAP